MEPRIAAKLHRRRVRTLESKLRRIERDEAWCACAHHTDDAQPDPRCRYCKGSGEMKEGAVRAALAELTRGAASLT